MTAGQGPQRRLPNIGPGREALPRRTRSRLAATLLAVIAAAVVLGIVLASGHGSAPPRVVTIPVADRSASPALLGAAEAVGFTPQSEPGTGRVEDMPAGAGGVGSGTKLLPVGSQAPGFALRTPTGARVGLASLRGRAVLLEFFATWCPHCAAEAPHLVRLFRSLPRSRYAFLAIVGDGEDAASVLAYHIWFGIPYPALLDPGKRAGSFHAPGAPGPVSSAYRVASLPTFYVLDGRGRIVWAGDGEQPDALLRRMLLQAGSA